MKYNVLGLIPARKGSKGVPNKNKRVIQGKPLISFTIDAALLSTQLTHVAVTTDDPDIIKIAKQSGVIAIQRPASIAQDDSPVIETVRHSLSTLETALELKFDSVVLLQPTSPLRDFEDIDNAIGLFYKFNRNPVCSVYRCEDNHPARMYTIFDGRLVALMPDWAANRRQDLPDVYHRNGALYVFGWREVESGNIISMSMTPYIMRQRASINIDTEIDFHLLEVILAMK